MAAYQEQRQLAFATPSEMAYVDYLLHKHRNDRILLFTERNAAAYEMSRRFLVPVIMPQTKVTELSTILERFGSGVYNVLVTSRVLNEGVDMPAANVGIVISGGGSVREHARRLGRILRKQAHSCLVGLEKWSQMPRDERLEDFLGLLSDQDVTDASIAGEDIGRG